MAPSKALLAGTMILSLGCTTSRRAPDTLSAAHVAKAMATPVPTFEAAQIAAEVVAPPVTPMPSAPFALLDDHERAIQVYPPIAPPARAPMIVFLHATCMQPAPVCDAFGSAGRDAGWLVCPSGNTTCAGQPDWHGPGSTKAAFLESALTKVEAELPTFVDARPGVLIGWSRGAFAARDILDASVASSSATGDRLTKRFRGLVLIAAQVTPKVAMLRGAGITRVVMAAGDQDMSKSTMVAAVEAVRAGGIEARFVSLGKIGHVWPTDFEARMKEPIAWAAAAP